MIHVTSTLIVHRPERLLFYCPEINEEIKSSIRYGMCPQVIKKYQSSYGTYDEAGIFYLSPELKKEVGMDWVVGIEYRKDDDNLQLPKELSSVVVPSSNIIIFDITYENQLNDRRIKEIIEHVKKEKNTRSQRYRYVENGLVSFFSFNAKLRVMLEIELIEKQQFLYDNDFEEYSKKDLYYRAYHEPITEYHNWAWMTECLETYYLEGVKDYGFVHFDIKDFKMINELYNHQVANEVLKRVAQNMEAHKDWIYFGARCDNDNFAMMIRDMPEQETRDKLNQFFDEISRLHVDLSYVINYRCGVVSMRYAMNAGDIVADCAKLAQSMGQEINKTEINFYTSEMHENALWGKQLKAYLDAALKANEFMVYLQPKMNIDNEKVCGAEALIRWNYKHKSILSPFRFIPYFEADDSIIKVDEFVLHSVCSILREWEEKGYELFPISVNLSRKHMIQPFLANHLEQIVDLYGVDHSLIEFELTETTTYDNHIYMIAVLKELKNKGFRISMDDFGTGYSSFALLKDMPLDTLKIDKSFIDLIVEDEDCAKISIILRHIISMSNELGIDSIAEGVEDYTQVSVLRDWGCKIIQGYYFSKPIPISEFEEKYLE